EAPLDTEKRRQMQAAQAVESEIGAYRGRLALNSFRAVIIIACGVGMLFLADPVPGRENMKPALLAFSAGLTLVGVGILAYQIWAFRVGVARRRAGARARLGVPDANPALQPIEPVVAQLVSRALRPSSSILDGRQQRNQVLNG